MSKVDGIVLQPKNLVQRKKIAWLVSILVDENKRDIIINELKKNGIDVRAFFIPLSEMDIYSKYATKCSNSKAISKRGINLPTTIEINGEVIEKIAGILERVN